MRSWRSAAGLVCAVAIIGGGALLAAEGAGDGHAPEGLEVLRGAQVTRVHDGKELSRISTAPAPLAYRGGYQGTGVMTGATNIVLVYWGSQWTNNDPSGEAAIQQNFFASVGGSFWNGSVTQYCQGVASGTVYCNGGGTSASNVGLTVRVIQDTASAAPAHPSQSQIAAEAVRAAQLLSNTTQTLNNNVQYVINTAHGSSSRGFGTQYCAYHSSQSSSVGQVAYTYMPYITDAGASCGANFNGLGAKAGITIVGGHEFAETETDIFPSTGWLDKNGAENGDKCAWITSGQGAAANVTMPNGRVFPVQSLWSNAFNGGAGGCVLSY